MKYNLLKIMQEEITDEAKRLADILYDESCLFLCDIGDKYDDNLNKIYWDFKTDIQLKMIYICDLKCKKEDYKNFYFDLDGCIEHHKKYIEFKKKLEKIDLNNVVKKMGKEIKNNKEKYNKRSIFSVVPELAKKFINGHYDSVDFTAIIMLIEEELSKYDIVFNTTLFEI